MRKIDKIIIHCTATPEGRAVTVADIDRWHKQQGYGKIGYHYVITLDGKIHEGRDFAEIGAHTKGHNANSIGVCYIGGLAKDGKTEKDTRTPEQIKGLNACIDALKKAFPSATIHGHNEFANKACPCFDVKKEFN